MKLLVPALLQLLLGWVSQLAIVAAQATLLLSLQTSAAKDYC
jgi:hypothetical protein